MIKKLNFNERQITFVTSTVNQISEFKNQKGLRNALQASGIYWAVDLLIISPSDLLKIRGFGKMKLAKIEETLKDYELAGAHNPPFHKLFREELEKRISKETAEVIWKNMLKQTKSPEKRKAIESMKVKILNEIRFSDICNNFFSKDSFHERQERLEKKFKIHSIKWDYTFTTWDIQETAIKQVAKKIKEKLLKVNVALKETPCPFCTCPNQSDVVCACQG